MMKKRKRSVVEKEDGDEDKENFVYFAHGGCVQFAPWKDRRMI